MTRLQKKCLIAVTGTHFLLVVALACSGFMRPKPKPANVQLLDVIPAKAIEAAFTSGVHDATPPPPSPPVKPVEPTPPTPPPPQPQVTQPKPPEPVEPETHQEQPAPDDNKPADIPKPKPPKKHVIDVDLKKVARPKIKETDHSAEREAEAEREAQREAKRERDARARALLSAATSIRDNASSSTEVNLPGASSEAYASFGSIVVSVYHHHWIPPENMTTESAIVTFTVTISRDGSVLTSHIISPSGEPNIDRAVRQMLDRVTFIHAFPDDDTDQTHTYTIDFNATRTSIQ